MTFLQTAVKNVDVTDPLNRASNHPFSIRCCWLVNLRERQNSPVHSGPARLQGAIVVQWHWGSVFSAHTLQFTPTHHSTASRHSGTKQAKWESTWPWKQSVYGVLTLSSVFQSERNKNKSRLQTWETLAFTKKVVWPTNALYWKSIQNHFCVRWFREGVYFKMLWKESCNWVFEMRSLLVFSRQGLLRKIASFALRCPQSTMKNRLPVTHCFPFQWSSFQRWQD